VPAPLVVAHLLERLTVGGAEMMAARLAAARAGGGRPTLVYALQRGGALAARLAPAVGLRELDIARASVRRPLAWLASLRDGRRRLLAQLEADRVAVVQTHLPEANFWGLWLALSRRVNVVATVHSNDEFSYGPADAAWRRALRRRAYRLVLGRCHAVVAVSDSVRASLIEDLALGEHLAARILVVPNAVDLPPPLSTQERAALRASLGAGEARPLVVGAGRLSSQKNFRDLVAAAEILRDQGVDALTVIAGTGDEADALAADIARRSLTDRVKLMGVRDDLGLLLQAADLFVSTSLLEGLPLVLLEAMAGGCAVVGYRIAGVADLVEDGWQGRLVEPGRVADLATAIASLLADPQQRQRCGAAGRNLVAERYDLSRAVASLERLYERVDGAGT